jgi:hypothetical protein
LLCEIEHSVLLKLIAKVLLYVAVQQMSSNFLHNFF